MTAPVARSTLPVLLLAAAASASSSASSFASSFAALSAPSGRRTRERDGLLLAGLALALVGACYVYFSLPGPARPNSRGRGIPIPGDGGPEDGGAAKDADPPPAAAPAPAPAAAPPKSADPVVADAPEGTATGDVKGDDAGAADAEADADSSEKSEKSSKKLRHAELEAADKEAKALFKSKKFLEAAAKFTEALDICHEIGNLEKQAITLLNNRSAMYERAGEMELAISDCDALLELDPSHEKARTKRMRMFESRGDHADALTEVCALQLNFMKKNRDRLRMGVQVEPPVSQQKIEDLVASVLPGEVERANDALEARDKTQTRLPNAHTVMQLMSSFSGYEAWTEAAAADSSADDLALMEGDGATQEAADRAQGLLRRGRRLAYERRFGEAATCFDAAIEAVGGVGGGRDCTDFTEFPRLLEWAGICRHLRYDLAGALECYDMCAEIEPDNVEMLVRRAGVKMDDGKAEEASDLFEAALVKDPSSRDALLHRSNLWLLKGDIDGAKRDLEKCNRLYPNYLLGHLRLATVQMQAEDPVGARASLDASAAASPNSSDVRSYRGELLFAEGKLDEARAEFEAASALDPGNPTPYVNGALVAMSAPDTTTGMPDVARAVELLTKALEVDPQFLTAYLHLGQLRLSTSKSIVEARGVVELYDRGLAECRSKDELRDLCSMRILAVAQIEAATQLGMETFSM